MKRWSAGLALLVLLLCVLVRASASTARAQADPPEAASSATPVPPTGSAPPPGAPGASAAAPRAALAMRVFNLRYRKLDDAYMLISPYVSARGSVRMQPAQRTLTVQDVPENLARITGLIGTYDVPPRNVAVSVQLIMASAGASQAEPPAPPIRGVIDKLSALNTRWSDYKMVGNARVRGTEGERSSLKVGDDYKVDFRIDQVTDENRVIRFKPFELSRREPLIEGPERYTSIVNTVLNLRDSQLFIVGASRAEQSNRALFMTITASLERP